MAWPIPEYSKKAVDRAGAALISDGISAEARSEALVVLTNWRACHGYPINTFQSTLRDKLQRITTDDYVVAQRLKRTPSIIAKLRRFPKMSLARMQDIGGLRAVVDSLEEARLLRESYLHSQFTHQLITNTDYIDAPKPSGYRGFHLVYRYRGKTQQAQTYDGLQLELQIRTRNQHAWATAVETAGTFLDQSLKSSEGPTEWLAFFVLASAGLAILENCPVPYRWASRSKSEIQKALKKEERRLKIQDKLAAFSVAANAITESEHAGSYHLIVLSLETREVSIQTYSKAKLADATRDYALTEERITAGAASQAVLVSTASIELLRRAYPNYFLDTTDFLALLHQITEAN